MLYTTFMQYGVERQFSGHVGEKLVDRKDAQMSIYDLQYMNESTLMVQVDGNELARAIQILTHNATDVNGGNRVQYFFGDDARTILANWY